MRIPAATYRLQFSPSFGFQEAGDVIDYLAELGITDIYASPVFTSRRGSTHGYDIVDPTEINPELGGDSAFTKLVEKASDRGLGWIQDIVPNHTAFDGDNTLLVDVLENGEFSAYRGFFDIEWTHPYESLRGRLLAPFLPGLYGESLEKGEIRVEFTGEGFRIRCFDLLLPLRIESYRKILSCRLNYLRKRLGKEHPGFVKLSGVIFALKGLKGLKGDVNEREGQVNFIKRMLRELYEDEPEIREYVDENVRLFNGRISSADRYMALDGLLSEQLFRLSFWKVATEEINYRRFFNINGLISLKVEDERVFDYTHGLVLGLARARRITGLRVDHIDGLFDPAAYLGRLRERAGDVHIVVEKILSFGEELPDDWPVEGTTGYDFLNHASGIFCNVRNKRVFTRIYSGFTGIREGYDELFQEKKRLIIEKHMTGDVDNLARMFGRILARDRYGSDITHYGLKKAIVEILSCFPVYRTYIAGREVRPRERAYILEAVDRARKKNPAFIYEINFIGRFLLLEFRDHMTEEEKGDWVESVMRFQQFTGPLMAKGFEDTMLYVYNRLISLNEVGGFPDRFGLTLKGFHEFNSARAGKTPLSLNATSTHDAKRGEDVRARINVLSEMPEEWEGMVKRWSSLNRKHRRTAGGRFVPDKNDEYFLYQTLVGAMPFAEEEYPGFAARLKDYIIKAVREAKVHTEWLKPDVDYEESYLDFVLKIIERDGDNNFLASFIPFQRKVAWYGILNSLSQTLLKITSPGVPDFYQGSELWDLNLVDPDNRRPVDYEKRKRYLEDITRRASGDPEGLAGELLSDSRDGRIKLFLIWRALSARLAEPLLFEKGGYLPLESGGWRGDNVVAFARSFENLWAVTVAPRLLTGVVREGEYPVGEGVWGETFLRLPAGAPEKWREAITGLPVRSEENLALRDVLKIFPVALLTGREGR